MSNGDAMKLEKSEEVRALYRELHKVLKRMEEFESDKVGTDEYEILAGAAWHISGTIESIAAVDRAYVFGDILTNVDTIAEEFGQKAVQTMSDMMKEKLESEE